MENKILFCHAEDPEYGFLSNMYLQKMVYAGDVWTSAEHCYQAQKFTHIPKIYKEVCSAVSGNVARDLAKKYKHQRHENWNEVKEELLFDIMKIKFTTIPEMSHKLLATNNAVLIKSVPDDPFWGVLPDGTGENMMGEMIMNIRTFLKENKGES